MSIKTRFLSKAHLRSIEQSCPFLQGELTRRFPNGEYVSNLPLHGYAPSHARDINDAIDEVVDLPENVVAAQVAEFERLFGGTKGEAE